MTDPTIKAILDKDMDRAAYGGASVARGHTKKNLRRSIRAKNDPVRLAQLAAVRGPTQIGGERMRRCQKISKASGGPCPNPAVRGEDCCHQHLDKAGRRRLLARRRAEGRPIEKAHRLARRNLKTLLRESRIPYELMQQPVFQNVMRLVAPSWFGLRITDPFDRRKMGDAALLGREMVLAWMAGVEGDANPWMGVVAKAVAAGFSLERRTLV